MTQPSSLQREASRTCPVAVGGEMRGEWIATVFLEGTSGGLMLIERSGRVALCSADARRLLGPGAPVVGASMRCLLTKLGRSRADERRVALMRLREALRRGGPTTLDLTVEGVPILLDVAPLGEAGWSVVVEAAPTRAARLKASTAGSVDPLTGLPNRARFDARLDEARSRLARQGEGFAVLTIDLDRFKQVNDTLGHPVGDALLRNVAERLQSTLRPIDLAARLGGDEFAVIQADVSDAASAATLATRIVDLLGRAYIVQGHLVNIGASVGAALAPSDGMDPAALVRSADLALYRAKLDGRGAYRFFKPEMDAQVQARRQLELDLRRAVAAHEFELVYQPQMNLDTDRLVGCEALIRWRHPARGTVSPAEFIPLAEEIGLIVPIGEWVLRTACREATRWPGDLSVAVNLSPAQFRGDRLVKAVASALSSSGLAPRRLELEITEGLLLTDNAANLAKLHALRALGLRISMDDFGTGYSSLSYLRSFPFDKIKIDRSFVSGAPALGTGDPMAIVRAVASLGAALGMSTVAEGVETPEQMDDIRREGCTDVQGYLISRPVPAADIASLFAAQASAAGRSISPSSLVGAR